jgi:hypothetical protein
MLRLCEKLVLANGGECISLAGKIGYRIRRQAPSLEISPARQGKARWLERRNFQALAKPRFFHEIENGSLSVSEQTRHHRLFLG